MTISEELNLFRLLRNGSKEAREKIFLSNLNIINDALLALGLMEDETDDYYSIGLISLMESIDSYSDFGVDFQKYAYRKIYKDILIQLNKNIIKNRVCSLQDLKDETYEFEDDIIDRVALRELIAKLKHYKNSKYIIEQLYGIDCERKRTSDLAKELNISVTRIGDISKRSVSELKGIYR